MMMALKTRISPGARMDGVETPNKSLTTATVSGLIIVRLIKRLKKLLEASARARVQGTEGLQRDRRDFSTNGAEIVGRPQGSQSAMGDACRRIRTVCSK